MKVIAASFNPDVAHVYARIGKFVEDSGGHFHTSACETSADLALAVEDAEVLIAWRTPVTASVLDAGRRLRLIMSSGSGYDHIQIDEATRRSIAVTNSGTYNAIDVAEHTVTLILGCVRRVPNLTAANPTLAWPLGVRAPIAHRFAQTTVAIIGYGQIGALVARMLIALGFHVVAADPHVSKSRISRDGVVPMELDEALGVADLVSLHLRLDKSTEHIIDADALALMQPGGAIVNTSRGGLVDESALVTSLKEGSVSCAALDVLSHEPPSVGDSILDAPNLYITGHSAGVTVEAEQAWGDALLATLEAYRLGQPLPNRIV